MELVTRCLLDVFWLCASSGVLEFLGGVPKYLLASFFDNLTEVPNSYVEDRRSWKPACSIVVPLRSHEHLMNVR
jgi:hypothetical protein